MIELLKQRFIWRREAGFDHDKEHTKNLRKMISHIIYKNYLSIPQTIHENIY